MERTVRQSPLWVKVQRPKARGLERRQRGEGLLQSSWRHGVVASVVRRMNEVTVHWARLVLGWVTLFGRVYHHGM